MFTFVSILSASYWSYAGSLSDIMDNNLEHLCRIARLLPKDGPYRASGKAMEDYDKVPSKELCKHVERDMRFLCFHNDRDLADCCCTLSQILYVEEKNVKLTSKSKQVTLKALRCVLYHFNESRYAIADIVRSCSGEEDYDFLKTWDVLPYIQQMGIFLKQCNRETNMCLLP